MHKNRLDLIVKQELQLAKGLASVFGIIIDQCSTTLINKLEALHNWIMIEIEKDLISLLNEIQNIVHGRESHAHPVYSLTQQIRLLMTFDQGKLSNEAFVEQFKAHWNAAIQQGAGLTSHPGLIAAWGLKIASDDGRAAADPADIGIATTEIADEIKASFLLSAADHGRFKELKQYLAN